MSLIGEWLNILPFFLTWPLPYLIKNKKGSVPYILKKYFNHILPESIVKNKSVNQRNKKKKTKDLNESERKPNKILPRNWSIFTKFTLFLI